MLPISSMCCVAVPLVLVGLLGQTYVPQILAYRTDEKLVTELAKGFEQDQQEDAGKPKKKRFVQTSGGCKAWCMKQAVGFPLPPDEDLQELANAKCGTRRGMKDCKDCKGGGLTIPDCREKDMTEELVNAVEKVVEEVGKPSEVEDSVCKVEGDYTKQPCTFNDLDGEMICSHVDLAWCPPPSRNAGQKFRFGKKPLCCSPETESNTEDINDVNVAESKKTVMDALKAEAEADEQNLVPEPTIPLPVCAVGENFEVTTFKRQGQTVPVCRNKQTKSFAKKVCCDPATFKMLEDKEKAEDVCAAVESKYCKPSPRVFDGKRKKILKKYPQMPDTFSCKRMYFCVVSGEAKFGPVPSQVWCSSAKTHRPDNFEARTACVAVAKYVEDDTEDDTED